MLQRNVLPGSGSCLAQNSDSLAIGTPALNGGAGFNYLLLVSVARQPDQAVSYVRFFSPDLSVPGAFALTHVLTAGDLEIYAGQTAEGTGYSISQVHIKLSAVGQCAASVAVISGALGYQLDSSGSATFTKTSSPSTGAVQRIAADTFLWGALATKGPVTDDPGTWTSPLVGGLRAGTTGHPAASNRTLHEGFALTSTVGNDPGALTGIISRACDIALVVYRAQ
jgi:hypothetical protein